MRRTPAETTAADSNATNRRSLIARLIAVGVALAAPTRASAVVAADPATPASAATPTADQVCAVPTGPCPQGCWDVTEIGPFIEGSFKGVFGVRSIVFQKAGGRFAFTFDDTGRVAIVAESYAVDVVAKVRIVGDVPTTVTFDGRIESTYTVAGDRLTLGEASSRDFKLTASLPFGDREVDSSQFFGAATSRFTCDGTATLNLFADPDVDAPIVLRRE